MQSSTAIPLPFLSSSSSYRLCRQIRYLTQLRVRPSSVIHLCCVTDRITRRVFGSANTMYLSQPRDLTTSMSTGCARSSIRHDHTVSDILPLIKAERAPPHRRSYDAPRSSSFYSSDHDYTAKRYDHPSSWPRAEQENRYFYDDDPDPTPPSSAFGPEGRSQSKWFRAQHFQKVWENLDSGKPDSRPPHPYTELIKLCILKRREGKLTLNQLYHDLEEKFPFFATSSKGKGWKVSSHTVPTLHSSA